MMDTRSRPARSRTEGIWEFGDICPTADVEELIATRSIRVNLAFSGEVGAARKHTINVFRDLVPPANSI
jgi:hypothetical protein